MVLLRAADELVDGSAGRERPTDGVNKIASSHGRREVEQRQ